MSAEEELRRMVEFLNEKTFGRPDEARRLELRLRNRQDLDGVLAFIVLRPKSSDVYPPPITLCWGGGRTADRACKAVIERFSGGGDLVRRFLPFTAGGLDELKLKAAAYYG